MFGFETKGNPLGDQIVDSFNATGKMTDDEKTKISDLNAQQKLDLSGYIANSPKLNRDDPKRWLQLVSDIKNKYGGRKSRRAKSRRAKSRRRR